MNFLTPQEVLDVLSIAKKSSTRDWLAFLFAYSHGLRAAEVCNLRTSDIKDGSIHIQRLKGSKKTVQPLVAHRGLPVLDEIRGLKEWLRIRPRNCGDFLFTSQKGGGVSPRHINRLFDKYATFVGLPPSKSHFHALKHSIATHLVSSGLDIAFVQVRLGHASLSSTQKYTHLNDDEVSEKAQNKLMEVFG